MSEKSDDRRFDVVVVGGGPAGLSAALWLGRCRHRVIVFDTRKPRNAASRAMHGYMTRDRIAPLEWLAMARQEVEQYGVEQREEEVVRVEQVAKGFSIHTKTGVHYSARKILVATGVCDNVPDIPGIGAFYGITVFHCPYCDGWEFRDRPLAAYGRRNRAVALALNLRTWSSDVVLFTDGPHRLRKSEREQLIRAGIHICTAPIAGLEGDNGKLNCVQLTSGEAWKCDALFFSNGHKAHCDIPAALGCVFNRAGEVITDPKQRTCVRGLYVAGDASIETQFVSVATAEGAKAAIAIHTELSAEDGWM